MPAANIIPSPVAIKGNLQALAVALNTVSAVSVKRTHEILSGVFQIPIATGSISNMVKRCADRLTDTVEKIKQKVMTSGLGHFDELGTRVDKKLWWVYNASNCEFTYLEISSKRWSSYWKYPGIQHAVCCAHLLRELTGITDNDPEQTWAASFIDLLIAMTQVKEKAMAVGKV